MRRRIVRSGRTLGAVEEQIITGVVVSDNFARKIFKVAKPIYFQSEYARIIYGWCKSYFDAEGKTPRIGIQQVYEVEKENLEESEQRIVKKYLENLSDHYERMEVFNDEYLYNKAISYFEQRSVELTISDAAKLLKQERTKEAVEKFHTYKKVANPFGFKNIFHPDMLALFYEDDPDPLLLLPERLGQLFGPLRRGWLLALLAPMKRGKSWFLDYVAVEGLRQGRNVLKISLEMSQKEQMDRLLKMTFGISDNGEEPIITIPTFDCRLNQDNTCRLPQRKNNCALFIGAEIKPDFAPDMRYRVCVACRDVIENSEYVPATWFKRIKNKTLTLSELRKQSKQVAIHLGGSIIPISFPVFSATPEDLIETMYSYEDEFGTMPDIVVVDYADILNDTTFRNDQQRDRTNTVWKNLKRIAGQFDCLVATATQGNRKSFERESMDEANISEDIRKLAHVDIMGALNQTKVERTEGVLRVDLLAHRHRKVDSREVMTLQALDIGQPVLDQDWHILKN